MIESDTALADNSFAYLQLDKLAPGDAPFDSSCAQAFQLLTLRLADTEAPQGPLEDEAARIIEAPHEAFELDARGQIRLGDMAVATMTRGADLLRPEVQVTIDEQFGAGAVAQVRRRMLAWTRDLVAELLAPLRAEAAGRMSPAGKGLVYQLEHGLGSCLRVRAEMQVRSLSADDRKICGQLGISLGALVVFVPALLEAGAVLRRAALWSAAYGRPPALPPAGKVSVAIEAGGVVAGQLWLQPIEKIPNPVAEPERHAYISNFFLRPALRGQGAGSALFATAMAWSRANGVDAVILWPTPRSRPLYERHGFSAGGGVMEAVVGSGRDLSGMA